MTLKTHHRLLLTGAAGGLGQALRERLKSNCSVLRLSDRTDLGAALAQEEIAIADLADAAAVDAAVQGCDAIVHLGGISVEGPFGPILQANILGLYHLYESARTHGVKRIVFASSNHVTGYYSQGETIDESNAPISRDLRLAVRERLLAGDSDTEVVDYIVRHFGEFVLFRPRASGSNLILWLAGPLLLLVALAGALVYLRGRARASESAPVALTSEEQARLRDILDR